MDITQQIDFIQPEWGVYGQEITISGLNYSANVGENTVLFNGELAEKTGVSVNKDFF